MSIKLFDIVNEINHGKNNVVIMKSGGYSAYNAFMVNRALSQNAETIIPAQIMNYYHGLDKDIQMEYLIQSIPKKKRYSKWAKETPSEYLECVVKWYNVSKSKAVEIIGLLDADELDTIYRMTSDLGGRSK